MADFKVGGENIQWEPRTSYNTRKYRSAQHQKQMMKVCQRDTEAKWKSSLWLKLEQFEQKTK